ncbi:MAG: serine hydroxymethyltransferase [Alphaproteobacteria bacterium]|nr:serine hydroxymethyltransferase [Alphaproteobacteria bacterium]
MAGEREIFFEIARLGDVMRVSAIDGETGLEATAIGPANALQSDLERIALGKLERKLASPQNGSPPRPGRVV